MRMAVHTTNLTVALCCTWLAFPAFAETALPAPIKRIQEQGIEILKPFTAPGGMKGWLGRYQGMGVTIYLTPDGKHAISGYMYDEEGKNLSENLFEKELYIPEGRRMWQRLQQTPAIEEGKPDAPRTLVVFADPFCLYCHQFWLKVQPWVNTGKVRLRTILVGVIRPKSGRYAAAILNAVDPVSAWRDFERSNGKKRPPFPEVTPAKIYHQLQYHQQLMDELGGKATPAIYYLDENSALQQSIGLPEDKQFDRMVGE